ncbi:tellurite resistance TerB family protein [Roseomonas xinghualingensis]|uniref:tellurite resistance TerB family protein n=1 Tax=Roseomonas xinghualingensis TaxID=2986475 RepID=UPI0021F14294|nr:tellurite resistance TerB family protein [Roseomonas sp. SXEYE001]MCV4207960.1 tellurite resistance TerB family protein [Roseomonas sp. SXEYE001]
MFDTKRLLEGFLGAQGSKGQWSDSRQGGIGSLGGGRGGSLQDVLGGLLGGGIGSLGGKARTGGGIGSLGGQAQTGGGIGSLGGAIGTAAAGGLLGSVLGGRRRSGGGGLLRMGGLAVLGTLAYRAYQQWQETQGQGQAAPQQGRPEAGFGGGSVPASTPASGPWSGPAPAQPAGAGALALPPAEDFARDDVPAADGQPFGLSLVKAMISAAKADGHMDGAERGRVFEEVERLELDAEAKGFVFQALDAPADPSAVAAMARTEAQKAEIYMVSRLVAEPDTAAERAYLDALAHRLGLAAGLRQSLDQQAAEASRIAASGQVPGQPS